MKDKSQRGMLTQELKNKAEKYLDREFTQKELRLYPFIVYCVTNGGKIPREKTDYEEREILQVLESEGRLVRKHPSDFYPTKEFWTFMNDCLADSYVILAEDLEEEQGDEEIKA